MALRGSLASTWLADVARWFLRLLRCLQDQVGIQQDADVASSRLYQLIQSGRVRLSAQTTFEMGRMVERHRAAGARARDEYERTHYKLRKRWKKLRQKLEQLSEQPGEVEEAWASATDPARN